MRRSAGWALPPRSPSLFGKLPSALDFVRLNHDHPAAIALDAFAQAALQQLIQQRARWPALRVRFVFQPPDCSMGLIGALAPSHDRAGRAFPIALFAALPTSALAEHLGLVPRAYADFFAALDLLLDRLPTLPRDALQTELATLPMPRSGALSAAAEARGDQAPLRAPPPSPAGLLRAMSDARPLASDRAPVLDCTLSSHDDLEGWLGAITRARGPMPEGPSAFWSAEADRLLVALGAIPPQLPLWLAEPARRHERLISVGRLHVSTDPSPP